MSSYAIGFKNRMVQRMTGPRAISASALAVEVGVPQPTLSAWLRNARSLSTMPNPSPRTSQPESASKSPTDWTTEEKLQIVIEAASVPDDRLGAFLRQHGIHAAQLDTWRKIVTTAAKAALEGGKTSRKGAKSSPEAKRIEELEREVRRKDRALAEVTALLALKKKVEMLWGDGDESTRTKSGT